MALTNQISEMSIERQLLLGGTLLALVVALFVTIYLMFFRVQYDVLFSDLRAVDAAAIVGELETRGVPFKLADGEKTILVPMDQISKTKIAIAGSDLPIRGAVGFELFNESDMGLTEFAQKINYQRALQGELARTIMAMDEIDSARVHLAIPERAIFRGDKTVPKAAITIRAKIGKTVDSASVDGIQKLVASSVNDLQLANVAVLDDKGRLISQKSSADEIMIPELAEKKALEQYYRARIVNALRNIAPGQNIRAEVRATSLAPGAFAAVEREEDTEQKQTSDGAKTGSEDRNFRLLVRLIASADPAEDDAEQIRKTVEHVIGFNTLVGDRIIFSTVGNLARDSSGATGDNQGWETTEIESSEMSEPVIASFSSTYSYWLSLGALALVFILGLLMWLRWKRGGLSFDEQLNLSQRIDAQLATEGEA